MKKRIKIDGVVLSLVIILTGFLYQFSHLYPPKYYVDDIMDFFGIILIIKGIYFRMASRGHKKVHSDNGEGLVKTGLYKYMRNPMYLGSFMIGMGFSLILWPWWMSPIFALLFYLRFQKEIVNEEEKLTKIFGDEYKDYCKKTPRIFPRYKEFWKINVKKCFPWKATWETKEKRNLIILPLVVLIVEIVQEKVVYDIVDIRTILTTFLLAAAVFSLGFWYRYKNA